MKHAPARGVQPGFKKTKKSHQLAQLDMFVPLPIHHFSHILLSPPESVLPISSVWSSIDLSVSREV
jgi:hypothetical protein